MDLLTFGFAVCVVLGLCCFALFNKCIDWFENI